jgi:uncharacterized protein YoxC
VEALSQIAGFVAACAFVVLVALFAWPLIKLGRVFQETTRAVKELTEHTLPVLDQAQATVAGANVQLEKVDSITTQAQDVSQNVSALTALFAATLGGPLIKLAAFTYGVRTTLSRRWGEK